MDLVLHHYWRSSSSWRVRWALEHKGVAYRGNVVDLLKGEQGAAEFKQSSPLGVVPCLVVDGRALTESVAILEWLEEAFPEKPLLPKDPWKRARVRQLVEFVNAGTQPLQNLGVMRHHSTDLEQQKVWARHWIVRGLAALEHELEVVAAEGSGGKFAVGDELTWVELFVTPQLYNARRFSVDLTQLPRLSAVDAAALATESGLASHPDRFQPSVAP